MSDLGTSISAVSAAGVQSPVRAIDPVRRRLPSTEEAGQSGNEPFVPFNAAGDDFAIPAPADKRGGARGGFGSLLGAFTSFVASLFSQSEVPAAQPAPASMQAATAAYSRGAVLPEIAAYEVLSPSLPRLSSGRALDLSV